MPEDATAAFMGAHDCRGCPPLQLSEQGQRTVEAMRTWKSVGAGRLRLLRELAAELLALQEVKP